MDWVGGASGQKKLGPQPYAIPRSHPLSGTQVRGFKHNPGTCPNRTLHFCQGGRLLTCHGQVYRNNRVPIPTDSGLPCSSDGRSQLPAESEIWLRHYPPGVGVEVQLFRPIPTMARKTSKADTSAGP